ncbi:MAG: SET domain-containing protein [Endozoicomonas sp. (ex Botrylloides leachii)]|nr:SET domain-containing protein [Endozoicomonas sp. (ex Botrylloides leachii)]
MSVVITDTKDKNRGVFSKKVFILGDTVIIGKPTAELTERTWQSLQVGINRHVRMDQPFELVNHSCNPNCGLKLNQYGGYNLIAMKDIAINEEITFDYCMSEWVSIAVEKCLCNDEKCRKSITGGKDLTEKQRIEYAGFLAPFYDELIAQQE